MPIEAITTVLHAYGSALKDRNVKETVALYTSDGVIMPPHFSASAGTQALKETYERIFNSIQLTITFDIDEIVLMSPDGPSQEQQRRAQKLCCRLKLQNLIPTKSCLF
ncbi:hypothetical protein LB503_011031 [Fusarium chuoi]|nr:hypothetical protein LB503_011031 [Fusarium chuoi]